MAAIRRNIVQDSAARDAYIQGVQLLKQELPGPTTGDLGLPGPATEVSTYDLFVAWHYFAMFTFTPPSQSDRNAAHLGPVFLPWHRFMLVLLELHLQRVLDDAEFGLPYWHWAADGELELGQQPLAPIWDDRCMGGDGDPVTTGPFAEAGGWRVRLETDRNGQLRAADRGLRRAFVSGRGLPRRSEVAMALELPTYDAPPWSGSSGGFRNFLEGWWPSGPGLHNQVHVWISGDMALATSPSDPVFYLNHCNVDRIWTAWQQQSPDSPYLPDETATDALRGHRIDDPMHALLSQPVTPRRMLNVEDFYSYDTLDVA